ncbi:MAG: TatD family hydrolase [Candidatus Pacebacteria bacterium]|nr:TatD family hydrolase [Candidatus Paceibacterota bacterium]
MSIIIDAHSHIQFHDYNKDRDETIGRAREAGVKTIAVGADMATSEQAIKIAYEYPEDIWATVGFHPNDLNEETREGNPENFNAGKILKLAEDEKVVAIGECGLEYYRLGNLTEETKERIKKIQKKAFLDQAEIAKKLNKPLMIHCRPTKGTDDANLDIFDLLKSMDNRPKFIMHFYAGSLEMAKKFYELGGYFTFGGVITFSRDKDEVVGYLPLERLLLETDAPYVAPEPYRGKRNEPAYVVEIAKRMAQIKNVSFEEIVERTYKNCVELFGI